MFVETVQFSGFWYVARKLLYFRMI